MGEYRNKLYSYIPRTRFGCSVYLDVLVYLVHQEECPNQSHCPTHHSCFIHQRHPLLVHVLQDGKQDAGTGHHRQLAPGAHQGGEEDRRGGVEDIPVLY